MLDYTPGDWTMKIVPASVSLEETGYAHQLVKGGHGYTVAFTACRNYAKTHVHNIGGGLVRITGIERRKPDLSPHPDLRLLAAAPRFCDALRMIADGDGDPREIARLAIATL